jgi:glucose dehydrogenase
MTDRCRLGVIVFCCLFILARASAQTDWPMFGHDPGGMRYSPLKQINTTNVQQLRLAWQFDTAEVDAPPATAPECVGNKNMYLCKLRIINNLLKTIDFVSY